jgi:hypothetical protein
MKSRLKDDSGFEFRIERDRDFKSGYKCYLGFKLIEIES